MHQKVYQNPNHPYHYCLELLLERYVKYLSSINERGDVLAESRGECEDKKLKEQYQRIYKNGNWYNSPEFFQKYLTSNSIKIKRKDCIEGLELADLLVLASKLDVLKAYNRIDSINSKFNERIIEAIKPKYYKDDSTTPIGYGKKLVPKVNIYNLVK